MLSVSPAEYVTIAIALLTVLGGLLAYWIRLELTPLRAAMGRLDELMIRLDQYQDDEERHRQAGLTWARALHRHLVRNGHDDAPDPDHYPGI